MELHTLSDSYTDPDAVAVSMSIREAHLLRLLVGSIRGNGSIRDVCEDLYKILRGNTILKALMEHALPDAVAGKVWEDNIIPELSDVDWWT